MYKNTFKNAKLLALLREEQALLFDIVVHIEKKKNIEKKLTVQLYKYKDEGGTSVQRQCGRSVDEGNFQVPGRKTKVRIFCKTI